MHFLRAVWPLVLSMAWPMPAHAQAVTGIDDMRSSDTVHGLYEIREAARAFVARENAAGGGTGEAWEAWEALEPNLKVFVPRCAVPLVARWHTIRWSAAARSGELVPHSRRVIAVGCARTVGLGHADKWDVHVPVASRRR